ncbi:FAD-dependent oxidoreductase [Fusobacterium sp. PH5-44]|uniref:FAD-dependent oxidoreductase n=1 Tax=unclassified Fusobacterium TaxID=2648384 RepID=UPI003D1ECFAF
MKVIIIGGVAAGTKVAAKLKRESENNEVIILNKGKNISYAGCGLPYYVGNVVKMKEDLIVNTPEMFEKRTGAVVHTEVEVVNIDRENKNVTALDLSTGHKVKYPYDKLVIATGARATKPPVEGIDLPEVYTMREPDDAIKLRDDIREKRLKRVAVIGGGYIGMELIENLLLQGISVYLVEMAPRILMPFDKEFSEKIKEIVKENGVIVLTDTKLEGIYGNGKVEKIKTSCGDIEVDGVVLSAGIKPNTEFLKSSGLTLMANGTIQVNEYMETNDPNIYAAGDCVSVKNSITGDLVWSPMGSSANIEGRLLAQNLLGAKKAYKGVLGTAVAKIPGINVGKTGLNEEDAKKHGFEPISVVAVVDDKTHYYPNATTFTIKLIADRKTLKILGVEVMGKGSVDKIVDIMVMCISMDGTLHDLEDLDFSYAPPFSTAIHPLVHVANILFNKINNELISLTPIEFEEIHKDKLKIVDAGIGGPLNNFPSVSLTDLGKEPDNIDKNEEILLVCKRGKGAYLVQCRLKSYGYQNTKVLEGGSTFNIVEK